MFDHLSLGVRELAATGAFYDAALAPLGLRRLSADATSLACGDETAGLWLLASEHPMAADPRSGVHVCFRARNRAAVDGFHAAGLAHGGRDNGAPGARTDYGADYYAAFVVDPDGYRLEAYTASAA